MKKIYLAILIFIFAIGQHSTLAGQSFTNKGKDFWTNFYRGNGVATSGIYHQMKIYIGGASTGDSVKIAIAEGKPQQWVKTYWVPADSIVASDTIPNQNIVGDGLYANSAIHITSRTANIVAYAHIYESATSAAAILLPVPVWGQEHYVLSAKQYYSSSNYAAFHIVANHDSTWVEISPSQPTLGGWTPNGGTQPNGSYLVKLNKGDCYQVLGALLSAGSSYGYDLTGSRVRSIPNAQGVAQPIALFCGSTRTGIGCGSSPGSSGDVLYQQAIPTESWGTKYGTAPTNNNTGPNAQSAMFNLYRIMVNDPATIVYRNGSILNPATLVDNRYYMYESNTADYIVADKPIVVAQYMSSNGSCPNTGSNGDPEMFYLSPLEQSITKTSFYRNDVESIDDNFVTLIVPSTSLPTLKIDGILFSAIPSTSKYTYAHPNLPGYNVVVRRWTATPAQCTVENSAGFTGITYGLGSVESYGYNIGGRFDSINLQTIQYNTIYGSMFYDKNRNGVRDAAEPPFVAARANTAKGNDTIATMTSTGNFLVYTDTGKYVTSVVPYVPYHIVAPFKHISNFPTYGNTDTALFAVQPIPGQRDIAITVIPLSLPRLGRELRYKILYFNKGTDTIANGTIEMIKSSKLLYDTAVPLPVFTLGDTLRWNYVNLKPLDTVSILVSLIVRDTPFAHIGDTLTSIVTISPAVGDLSSKDNSVKISQVIIGAYDPNFKEEDHAGKMHINEVINGNFLTYTVHFQNTGNDTAFNVQVKDTLDNKLDWSTMEMLTSSHNYQLTLNDGKCLWAFNHINLVDSNLNEPASHGYLVYRIKPRLTVVPGNVINNRASIYFDYNFPVVTNLQKTTIVSDVLPLRLLTFTAKKEGTANRLQWSTTNEVNVNHFELERSVSGDHFTTIGKIKAGLSNYSFTDNNPPKVTNYYRLKMIDRDGQFTYSPVRMLNNSGAFSISIYPNPAKDNLQVQIDSDKKTALQLQVLSTDGKVMLSNSLTATEGSILRSINISALPKGNYYLKATIADKDEQVVKFEKL